MRTGLLFFAEGRLPSARLRLPFHPDLVGQLNLLLTVRPRFKGRALVLDCILAKGIALPNDSYVQFCPIIQRFSSYVVEKRRGLALCVEWTAY